MFPLQKSKAYPISQVWTRLSDLFPKNRVWKGKNISAEKPDDQYP